VCGNAAVIVNQDVGDEIETGFAFGRAPRAKLPRPLALSFGVADTR
jgi:hypothetical protein